MWLFQLVFAAISPLIDLALLVLMVTAMLRVSQHGRAQTSGNVGTMALYWLAFTTVDIVYGWIGYRLDGRNLQFPALLLVAQRLIYPGVRQTGGRSPDHVMSRPARHRRGGRRLDDRVAKLERSGRASMAGA